MFDVFTICIILATFLLAGAVKGVTGLGLPTVSLAILAVAIDMPTAMALLLIPSVVTNLWQAFIGERTKEALLRIWPFLLMATVMVWLGGLLLSQVDLALLSMLLGGLLIAYSVVNLAGFGFTLSRQQEVWAGPLLGALNGILTGMTGSFVIPGVMYLQAIGLTRDVLIQAMGMLFTASTIALAVSLQGNDLLSAELGMYSALALIPAIIGMVLGQKVRKRLSEQLFKRLLFASLLLLGAYIIMSAVTR
ncbi:sulfite exporter TauE/SafE family protein [Neptunomonas japonica]|uniref:sulfite exporter TauE/SafE family protein n=1 Tax=Neptunomonas japonica TaxID=417574 RepID=UPI0003F4B081|nr:sulfite exporter TauE/SafE family protein [Neptunomonas japonica]